MFRDSCRNVPLTVETLHDEGKVGRVLVVDLDANQGNGRAAVFRDWDWAAIYDLFEKDRFPARKEPEDNPLPVALDAMRPDLVVSNAGSDPFVGDPLARFRLTRDDLAERDLVVVSMVRDRGIPLAMVLSGGYSLESWRIHADAIEGVLT